MNIFTRLIKKIWRFKSGTEITNKRFQTVGFQQAFSLDDIVMVETDGSYFYVTLTSGNKLSLPYSYKWIWDGVTKQATGE